MECDKKVSVESKKELLHSESQIAQSFIKQLGIDVEKDNVHKVELIFEAGKPVFVRATNYAMFEDLSIVTKGK